MEADITIPTSDIVKKPLKPRHALFVKEYMLTKNASLSVKNAGYITRKPAIYGYKLLQMPHIKSEIERLKALEIGKIEEKLQEQAEKREITREKYVDTTWKEYETTDAQKDKTNRLRALELSGKALGYIGTGSDKTTTNNLIINVDAKSLPAGERWDRLRQLIDGS